MKVTNSNPMGKKEIQMEKKVVVESMANVRISFTDPLVNDKDFDFVLFAIQSTDGGVNVGPKLFVFDHRPEVFWAARAVNPDVAGEDRRKTKEALARAVRQPAKVVVMEKTDGGGEKTFHYVNLYPTDEKQPGALFSMTSYTGKHNAGFSVKENNALWSWKSESSSRTGAHWEMVLVVLTDETHRVIVNSYGYANIGHSDENLTVVGAEIRQMSEEDLVIDFEP